MTNLTQKLGRRIGRFFRKSSAFSSVSVHIGNLITGLCISHLLTDDEVRNLESSIKEIYTASFSNFNHPRNFLLTLEESWNPELIIQQKKEDERKNSELESSIPQFQVREEPPDWFIGITSNFSKSIKNVDKKIQGRILEAIARITSDPISPSGDTIKRLCGEKDGMWRYRIGDYRIIYYPDKNTKHILLLSFSPRGSVYD